MGWDSAQTAVGILGRYEGPSYGPHMMGGGWWWMWIVWVVGFVLFVLLIYFLVAGLRGGERPAEPPRETPLEILQKRYARGEISREEYERMKRDLEG